MDVELEKKIDAVKLQLDAVYVSVERTRKYFMWTLIITIAVFVLPLVALFFIAPSMLSGLTATYGTLDVGAGGY